MATNPPVRAGIGLLMVATLLWGCGETAPQSASGPTVSNIPVDGQLADEAGQVSPLSQIAVPEVHEPVVGIVLDPNGDPLLGARVNLFRRTRAWPRPDRHRLDAVRSGKDGSFKFGISRSHDLELEVAAPGCALAHALVDPVIETLTVRLVQGTRVRGRVFLPGGRPLAQCTVYLEPGIGSRTMAREQLTDSNGAFTFDGVPADNLRVTARHPDYPPATLARVNFAEEVTLEFENRSSLGLSGKVVDESGLPVADSWVRVYPWQPNGLLFVPSVGQTDAKGEFLIRGLGEGAYRIEVDHPRHSSVARRLNLQRSRAGFDIELGARTRIDGTLVGLGKGREIELTLESAFGERGVARVKADGSFAFPDTYSQGVAVLALRQGGYCFARSRSRWLWQAPGVGLELQVEPASLVEGTVTGPDGRPLPGVEIATGVGPADGGWMARRQVLAVTDRAGQYRIQGLQRDKVAIEFRKPSFAQQQAVADLTARHTRNDLRLERPGRIEGLVTCAGKPIPGALVFVERGPNMVACTTTNREGQYVLSGLPPGQHVVKVKYSTLPVQHSRETVTVASGAKCSLVRIDLPAGRRVAGVVVDAEESPLAGVLVEGPAGSASTDRAGRFVLDLPQGPSMLRVRLSRADPVARRVRVAPNQAQVRVRLRQAPRAALRVARVLGLPRELPIGNLIVRLDPPDSQTEDAKAWAQAFGALTSIDTFTREHRRRRLLMDFHERTRVERRLEGVAKGFELERLPSGLYVLSVHAKGFQPYTEEIRLVDGETEDLKTLKLPRGGRVRGVVLDPLGRPIGGAKVVVGRESDLTMDSMCYHTDAKGQFEVRGVGKGNDRIFVASRGFATQCRVLDVLADLFRKDPITIRMQEGATIKVRVMQHESGPAGSRDVARFRVVDLYRGVVRIGVAKTDERGDAWFHNLGKDTYSVRLRGRGSEVVEKVIDETAGRRIFTVDLYARPGERRGRR